MELVHFTKADVSSVYQVYAQAMLQGQGAARLWSENEWQKIYLIASCVGRREAGTGRPQAFILFQKLPQAWEILHLATHPDWWRQNLMEELLREWLSSRPQDKPVWLEVHEGNHPARQLYEKIGFKGTGRRPGYYSDGGAAILFSYG